MDIEPYTVGQFYSVPCVSGRWSGRDDTWPVLGPKHTDERIIGFRHLHYHLDARFLTQTQARFVENKGGSLAMAIAAYPLHEPILDGCGQPLTSPEMKRRKCQRLIQGFPLVKFAARLEDAYECASAKAGICPHQGAPLAGLPVVDGVVTCPLHGLRWSIATGELVRTTPRSPNPPPSSGKP